MRPLEKLEKFMGNKLLDEVLFYKLSPGHYL